MLPYLNIDTPFPDVEQALDDPNGLLAAGGDLSCGRLMEAYSKGIFPWYSAEEPLLWWSPNPRTVFFLDRFKVHSSVKKTLKKYDLKVTLNHDFTQVINQCAKPRDKTGGTWITTEMSHAFIHLHQKNYAHSVEVWSNKELVGGIYGVVVGKIFCGESMFSRISNGSKIALSCLVNYLKIYQFKLIDCQVENPHLLQLGAHKISRINYLKVLKQSHNLQKNIWLKQTLNWKNLLK